MSDQISPANDASGRAASELISLVATENPFQRRRFERAGLDAGASLDEVPFLTKAELTQDQEANAPFGTNLTYPLERYTHMHQTSGTTGPPLRVLDTAEDWAWWRAGLARTFRTIGLDATDVVALPFSFGPHVQFWATMEGIDELGAMRVPLGGMTSLQRLRVIGHIEATAVVCTPSYAIRLLEVAVENRCEEALDSIHSVICTGEPGASLPSVRARVEDGFSARCFDHAGLTEVGPFGYPCSAGGFHIDEEEFACEILDVDPNPSGPDERGELVLTPLRRRGFPVLRYRTGDVVESSAEVCPEGHKDRWLPGGIVGRTDDMVVIRGMNVYPSAVEESVRRLKGSGEFRITFYSERPGQDEIKLEVELQDGTVARGLQETMREQLGLRVRVVPVVPGILPRQNGKARRVLDDRLIRRVEE
jgi:phenylacetate-CoA ligase